MHKDDLLKMIADTAYHVGFGAKKHFATYDMAIKIPGFIRIISLSIAIFALFIDEFSGKYVAAGIIIWDIISQYISDYSNNKQKYADIGVELTTVFNQLKQLYFDVKNCSENDLAKYKDERIKLEAKYNSIASYKQIMFSDCYAHYKFFWQQEIIWITEQKKFKLLADKIPLSLSLIIFIAILTTVYYFELLTLICSLVN
jgi:hypothetical protein